MIENTHQFFFGDQRRKYIVLVASFATAQLALFLFFTSIQGDAYIALSVILTLALIRPGWYLYDIMTKPKPVTAAAVAEEPTPPGPLVGAFGAAALSMATLAERFAAASSSIPTSPGSVFISYAGNETLFAQQLAGTINAALPGKVYLRECEPTGSATLTRLQWRGATQKALGSSAAAGVFLVSQDYMVKCGLAAGDLEDVVESSVSKKRHALPIIVEMGPETVGNWKFEVIAPNVSAPRVLRADKADTQKLLNQISNLVSLAASSASDPD